MKTKLFKCALSFALASALVFCTALVCYTQVSNFASADKFSDYLDTFVDSGIKNHGDLTNDFIDLAELYLTEYNYVMGQNFPGYEKVLTDIPIKCFKRLYDGTAVLVPFYGCYYYLDKNGVFTLNEGGIDRKVEKASFYVPSSDFKEAVEEANTNNAPKGKGLWKASYRTDKYIHSISSTSLITLWGSSSGESFSDELYITPFYTDYQGITYYSDYQFRLYFGDYILGDITDYALYTDVYKFIDGIGYVEQSNISGVALKGKSMEKPYTICLGLPFWEHNYNPYLDFGFYQTLSDYHSSFRYNPSKVDGGGFVELPSDAFQVLSSDGSSVQLQLIKAPFAEKYSDFYYNDSSGTRVSAPERTDIDLGYICSTEMISRVYSDVDTTKIPDNYYVTINGDTIYDYSITNPETGQSETINYYITNNYILPENGTSGGSGGSGGAVGGDVTVGGQIDVTGSVGVDVNVNINNGGNGGENIGDYIDASGTDVDVGGLLGKLPSLSKGFVDYLKGFFAWLPAEIYSLIILILVISVWNVFRSRR